MSRPFDLIIFGASGYTGKYCVRSLVQLLLNGERAYRFALAGRSTDRLRQVLVDLQPEFLGRFDLLAQAQLLQADVTDQESLRRMTGQCRVLVNAVGPYQLYGEQVVRACVEVSP